MANITEVYAFISKNTDGDAILGVKLGNTMVSMVTGDPNLLPILTKLAKEATAESGKQIRLFKFTTKEDLGNVKDLDKEPLKAVK